DVSLPRVPSTHPMSSAGGDTTQLVPGSPIRTPWDHSSVDSSPRPIAASHVLHRLLVPRHPPYALSNLTTQHRQPHDPTGPRSHPARLAKRKTDHTPQGVIRRSNKNHAYKDARIHCAILNQHQTRHRLSATTRK